MKFDLMIPETLLVPESLEDMIVNSMDANVFRRILLHGYNLEVSDISFQEGMPIIIKKNNLVFRITRSYLQRATIKNIVSVLHNAQEGDDSALTNIMQGNPSNLTYSYKVPIPGGNKGIRYRVNVLREGERGVSLVMRLNKEDIFDLNQIGLSEDDVIYKNMFPTKGLNLVTGSVDSGKTTLLYACLKHFILNSPRSAFIDTYESPIEGNLRDLPSKFEIFNKKVSQMAVPSAVNSFSAGITESLRRNADIILTGEIRTPDEVNGVINGVMQTGKLILGTMHTDNTSMSVNRMIYALNNNSEAEVKSKVYDLLSSLNMVVSQKLLETVDMKRTAVNETFIVTKEIRDRLQALPIDRIAREIKGIMIEEKATIVDRAKIKLEHGKISEETFDKFKASYSY